MEARSGGGWVAAGRFPSGNGKCRRGVPACEDLNAELKPIPTAFSIPRIAGWRSVRVMSSPSLGAFYGRHSTGLARLHRQTPLRHHPCRSAVAIHQQTGKVAPEHRRLSRYDTMTLDEITALPVEELATPTAHLYLWCPNALLPDGLEVMKAWGFSYKSNIVWHKVRKDGGSGGRGVGFYFRNVTELILVGVKGKSARTLAPGRRRVNLLATRKREHSRKPDEQYEIIETCSPGPFLELFARGNRKGWTTWGNQAHDYKLTW